MVKALLLQGQLKAMRRIRTEYDYLLAQMLSVLQDTESESYYRRLASTDPKDTIFEALSLVERAVHEGKIRKTRRALFVAIVKRTCADRGISMNHAAQPTLASARL